MHITRLPFLTKENTSDSIEGSLTMHDSDTLSKEEHMNAWIHLSER